MRSKSTAFRFGPVRAATEGLVTATLLVNPLNVVLVVAGLLILVGELRWKDLGLDRSELPVAIGVTVVGRAPGRRRRHLSRTDRVLQGYPRTR